MRIPVARIGALLSFATAVAACSGKGDPAAAQVNVPTVRVAPVGRADFAEVLTYVADLRAKHEVKVFSPVPDRILYFPWNDGDYVQRGQRLALIRKEGLDKGLDQLVAQMEALDIEIKNLEAELARSQELLDKGSISRQIFDQTQTRYLATGAQRKALEASHGQLKVTAGNADITAPIAGVVAYKALEVGDTAVPQVPLCHVLAIEELEATLRLIEADVAKVKVGQTVELSLDAYPGRTFTGTVTAVMPFLDAGSRTNTIEVTVPNPKIDDGRRLLKPGMFATARLVVGQRAGVLVAPEPALLLDNRLLDRQRQGEAVRRAFVVDGEGVAHERLVKLGARDGGMLEIREGLAEGDQLVVRGHHGLRDGQKVQIVDAKKI